LALRPELTYKEKKAEEQRLSFSLCNREKRIENLI